MTGTPRIAARTDRIAHAAWGQGRRRVLCQTTRHVMGWATAAVLLIGSASAATADDKAPRPVDTKQTADKKDGQDKQSADPTDSQAKLFKQFAKQMSNVRMTGHFTIDGQEDRPPAKEEYVIQSVSKLPQGNLWLFTARIKYGDKDLKLPMPLPVQWAGDTPVISLTDVTIPGLGTFSARVVIDNDKYAGTWKHGKVGGHLFGTISKLKGSKREGEGDSSQ